MSETISGRGDAVLPPPPGTAIKPPSIHAPKVARPASVEEADAAHSAVIALFDLATDRWRVAREELTHAAARDIVADADLVAAGKPQRKAEQRLKPAAERELAEAERERQVATAAARKTSAQLRAAIIAERGSWLAAAEVEDIDATEKFAAAVKALEQAAARLSATRGAVRWLEGVTTRDLPSGMSRGRLDVRIGNRAFELRELLQVLRTLADAPAKPKPRTATRGESTFAGSR